HVGDERQRVLDPLLADIAPGADHVGDDVDLQRLQAHGASSRETPKLSRICPVTRRYFMWAAISCNRRAVNSSAGKKVSSASSCSVMSTGVPNTMVVEMKLSTSPWWRSLNGIATLSGGSGPDRAGILKALRSS